MKLAENRKNKNDMEKQEREGREDDPKKICPPLSDP